MLLAAGQRENEAQEFTMPFFQDPPRTPDLFVADAALQLELRRRLPETLRAACWPMFTHLGEHTASTLVALAEQAERDPPEHIPYDAFGRRVDAIRTSAAWDALKDFSATHAIVATGHRADLGDRRRIVQAALIHLFSASSATFSCPLAMTDAAAQVLKECDDDDLRSRLLPRLLTTEPKDFITSGQWMTERAGGSDVGRSETLAKPISARPAERVYTLHGTKWFTSATTSEMALTLARIEDGSTPVVAGSKGLTLFCVELQRDANGCLDGIQVNRLKDKLGTRALPTAELNLQGVRATRLGAVGRGVATIATMLNITRFYNALASSSAMARATFLALDYAKRRVAFGKALEHHPLHQATLDALQADTAAALALCMEIADLLGRQEEGNLTPADGARLRGLIPIAKLTLGKQVVSVTSEALECFGGAGYIEDTGLPRMLRDAQVLPIWEGTTNVLSLDLLRAETKSQSLRHLLDDLLNRSRTLRAALNATEIEIVYETLIRLTEKLKSLSERETAQIEADARRVAMTTGHLAQAICLGEASAFAGEADVDARARFVNFVRNRLSLPI